MSCFYICSDQIGGVQHFFFFAKNERGIKDTGVEEM